MRYKAALAFTGALVLGLGALCAQHATAQEPSVTVKANPADPFTEHRHHQKVLNFDLFVSNHTQRPLHLVALRMKAYSRDDTLLVMRELNENGRPPALNELGNLSILPGQTVDYFQPFEQFSEDLDLFRLHFELLFMADNRAAAPVPFDADAKQELDVFPHDVAFQAFCLPLSGRILVHDGHDLHSHHRRRAVDNSGGKPLPVLPNQFADDFVIVDADGRLVRGDRSVLLNWLTYGRGVRAPAAGTVVVARGDLPENALKADGTVLSPLDADTADPEGFGNHVVIQHSDGRYSWILHLQGGSLRVKPGQHVSAGQPLGRVGFSGDALFPHVHYMATDSYSYPSRGMPTYFVASTVGDGRSSRILQLDTGDIVPALENQCSGSSRR